MNVLRYFPTMFYVLFASFIMYQAGKAHLHTLSILFVICLEIAVFFIIKSFDE